MGFREYKFDPATLWDEPETQNGYMAAAGRKPSSPSSFIDASASHASDVAVSEHAPRSGPTLGLVPHASAHSFNEEAFRLVEAALMVAQKPTRAATRRCRQRRQRALSELQHGAKAASAPAKAAAAWLLRSCGPCGKCRGIVATPPPRSGSPPMPPPQVLEA